MGTCEDHLPSQRDACIFRNPLGLGPFCITFLPFIVVAFFSFEEFVPCMHLFKSLASTKRVMATSSISITLHYLYNLITCNRYPSFSLAALQGMISQSASGLLTSSSDPPPFFAIIKGLIESLVTERAWTGGSVASHQ
jgi:hypothetical protein